MDDYRLLEVNQDQAATLKRLINNEYVKDKRPLRYKLVLKLMHSILELERPDTVLTVFPLQLDEIELWALDDVLTEDGKTFAGQSLRPLQREVWKLLIDISSDRVESVPVLPTATEFDDKTLIGAS